MILVGTEPLNSITKLLCFFFFFLNKFGSYQASVELSDDVSLRKLLKAKTKRDKRKVNFMTGSGLQAAKAEMERLCKVKDRLENLKQKLSRVQNRNVRKSSKSDVHDELVIYVPIVELREKV